MTLSKAEKLFLKAYRYNWDRGVAGLNRIIKSKDCDRGTALMLYWYGVPGFYKDFNSEDEVPEFARPTYRFLKALELRYLNNEFPEVIAYHLDDHTIPPDLGRIPVELTVPTQGEVNGHDLIHHRVGSLQLLTACREGDLETVKAMLSDGAIDINEKVDGSMFVEVAVIANQHEVVAHLIEQGANLKKKTGGSGFTLLQWGAQSKALESMALLLEHGLSVNVKGKWGRTALHQIVYWEEPMWLECNMAEAVAFLLAHGADPNQQDSDGDTPFDLAERAGNHAAIELMRA